MHKLTIFTQESFIDKKAKTYEVKVLFKAEVSPDLPSLTPDCVNPGVGAIWVTIPYRNEAVEFILAEAEMAAACAAVSTNVAEAFKTKKKNGPPMTELEIVFSTDFALELMQEKYRPSTTEMPHSLRHMALFSGAFLLGGKYTITNESPDWVDSTPYINISTSSSDIADSHTINLKTCRMRANKHSVISFLALEVNSKKTIARPFIALNNHILKAHTNGNFNREKLIAFNSHDGNYERFQVYANGLKMITQRHVHNSDGVETIIELKQNLGMDYQEYEKGYQERLAELNEKYRTQ